MNKHLLFLFAVLLPLVASAQTKVEIDGIWYNLDESALQAEVTYKGDYSWEYIEYFDPIAIPATVTYKNMTYSVTSIGEYAFASGGLLTSITLPESVTSIGDGAFSGCILTAITLPESVTSIGDEAFAWCENLTSITLPASVTSIGDQAFTWCYRLTAIAIPEGVTSIGDGAFKDCSSLTAITIPEGVTSIGDQAFNGCSSLAAIIVAKGNKMYDSRGGCNAIIETNSNTLIQGCSATTIPEGVTSIGDGAFSWCFSLTAITIPEGLTSIGDEAFSYCMGLTSITLPKGLTSIGDDTFSTCISLTAITIPEDVTNIGDQAFYGCSSLATITCHAVTPPTIGGSFTFESVDKTIPVYVPTASVEDYKTAEYWSEFTNIIGVETGIENSEIRNESSHLIYDLNGRRVEKAEKGIYIVNGKKVVIK